VAPTRVRPSSVVTSTSKFTGPAPRTPKYYEDQTREELYYIPSPNSREWFNIRRVRDSCTQQRVLSTHNTPGFIITQDSPYDGIRRVHAWEYLPDLLFWNPVDYFRTHPDVESVWIENYDPFDRVKIVHDPSDVDEIPLALILRRSELSFALASYIRNYQHQFFLRWNLEIPNGVEFTSTLHGK
jgi:hypothetical protein